MDPEIARLRAFLSTPSPKAMTAAAKATARTDASRRAHSGLPGRTLNEVEPVPRPSRRIRSINIDLALESLLVEQRRYPDVVSGPRPRSTSDTLMDYPHPYPYASFAAGPVAYERKPTGPDTDRRVVVIRHRRDAASTARRWSGCSARAQPRYGRGATRSTCCRPTLRRPTFLARVRERDGELSLLRGQVISFAVHNFDYQDPGADLTFLPRPEVTADQVILPDGVLRAGGPARGGHRTDVGTRCAPLVSTSSAACCSMGRRAPARPTWSGICSARHPGTTAVLLSGQTLHLLHDATTLARAAQPAIVVLEDCDLVAEHRGRRTNAALFETLEAMDGLAADADITFILTTNRADLLERALVERPGRVDLAVEITKPDLEGRERLFRLYAAELLASGQLSEAAVHTAAARTEGVTASFTKELIRRVRDQRGAAGPGTDRRRCQPGAGRDALRRRGSDPDPARGRGPLPGRRPIDEPEPGLTPSGWAAYRWDERRLIRRLGLTSAPAVSDAASVPRAALPILPAHSVENGRSVRFRQGRQPNQRRSSATGPPSSKRGRPRRRRRLDLGGRVSDRHAATGPAQHLDVVATVTEGQHVRGGDAEPGGDLGQGGGLVDPLRSDVQPGAPADEVGHPVQPEVLGQGDEVASPIGSDRAGSPG